MARPRKPQPGQHVPTEVTRKYARELYMGGTTIEEIGMLMDIDALTIVKHYRHELDMTFHTMRAALSDNLYQRAMAGNDKAIEFWLKTRGKWAYHKPPEQLEKDDKIIALLEQLNGNQPKV